MQGRRWVVRWIQLAMLALGTIGWAGEPTAAQKKVAIDPACQSNPVITYESYADTVQGVRYLYQSGQFKELDAALACLLDDSRHFASGRIGSSVIYFMFRTAMPAPGASPQEATRLKDWRRQAPKSVFLEFAELRFKYAMAWNARGGDFAQGVTAAGWKEFEKGLEETEKGLLGARKELRETPIWQQLLLAVVQDMSKSRSNLKAVFDEGVKKWPSYYDLYEIRLTRMVPKWGGNWQDVDSFIKTWDSQLKATEGSSMYARLYRVVAIRGVDPHETMIEWPRMKASFEDLVDRYPDIVHKNAAASFACAYGDGEYFRKAFGRIGPGEISLASWLPGTDENTCAHLAVSFSEDVFEAPDREVDGASQGQWSVRWWQWAGSFSYEASPVSDLTGERCAAGQQGSVWFLAGTYESTPVKRTCAVPAGVHLFFPLVNYMVMPSSCAGCLTCEGAVSTAQKITDGPMGLVAELDGRAIPGLNAFRQVSPSCFDLAARAQAGARIYPTASNGYYVMLKPLAKGPHVLRLGGSLPSLRQDVTYTLDVK